jgi:hypothetical protein
VSADTARYVTADYDRGELTVSPTIFPPNASSTSLVAVFSPGFHKSTPHKLSGGAIAGIAIGSAAVLGIAAGILIWLWLHKRKERKRQERERNIPSPFTVRMTSMDNTTIVGEGDNLSERGDRVEFYKPLTSPPPMDEPDYFAKPELDATHTARWRDQTNRHELSAGSVHRPATHSRNLSESSAGSGVSPIGDIRASMMGEHGRPLFGPGSSSPPVGGRPVDHSRTVSDQSEAGLFELGTGTRRS